MSDITYTIEDTYNGYVVHYFDEEGFIVWSEHYKTMKEIKTVYRAEIKAGKFE